MKKYEKPSIKILILNANVPLATSLEVGGNADNIIGRGNPFRSPFQNGFGFPWDGNEE